MLPSWIVETYTSRIHLQTTCQLPATCLNCHHDSKTNKMQSRQTCMFACFGPATCSMS